jgi:2,3-bisphosphoglycerate-dependent phosphoglycerate mutase
VQAEIHRAATLVSVTTLLLVRHGETDWNAERRWQGHTDVPLNTRGREQAAALAEQLAGDGRVDAVYSSDLSRARDTAQAVAQRLGLPVVVDPDLREIDVGSREGLTGDEVGERPWDGEPHEAHGERVLRAVHRIAAAHPAGRVLVVAHGGCLRRVQEAIDAEVDGWFGNCVVWELAYEDGVLRAID